MKQLIEDVKRYASNIEENTNLLSTAIHALYKRNAELREEVRKLEEELKKK